jgi:SNF2 family DNA or RNA helicase
MIALGEHLDKLLPTDKVVIFSQFLGMLDLLEDQFSRKKLKYVVISF